MSSLQGALALCLSFSGQQRMQASSQAAKRRPALDRGSCPVLSTDQSGEAG